MSDSNKIGISHPKAKKPSKEKKAPTPAPGCQLPSRALAAVLSKATQFADISKQCSIHRDLCAMEGGGACRFSTHMQLPLKAHRATVLRSPAAAGTLHSGAMQPPFPGLARDLHARGVHVAQKTTQAPAASLARGGPCAAPLSLAAPFVSPPSQENQTATSLPLPHSPAPGGCNKSTPDLQIYSNANARMQQAELGN